MLLTDEACTRTLSSFLVAIAAPFLCCAAWKLPLASGLLAGRSLPAFG